MKLKAWLKVNKGIFSERDLRFLIKDFFHPKLSLFLNKETYLESGQLERLDEVKKLYIKGVPLAYILGREEFFGWDFKIDRRVLIPRPETELLVEKAIEIVKESKLHYILDLCCGSSNIAVSIEKAVFEKIFIFASDISFKALEVSSMNSSYHNAGIRFINADLLKAFKYEIFDLIVCNPPYVESGNIKGSLNHEPRAALEAGEDGLRIISRVLNQAHSYLKGNGYLIMEIGYKHKSDVNNIIDSIGLYKIVEWIKDYSSHYRGVVLKASNNG